MPGELSLQSTLSRGTVPIMNVSQLLYCLLELRPAEAVSQATLPLNLCLVLDHSGSMSGQKIESLRDATSLVVDMLQPQDFIAVVSFNNRVEVAFPSQQLSTQGRRDELKGRVARLTADGGTNMAPAMEAGIMELRKQMPASGSGGAAQAQVNRLVLLTDGITEKEKRCLEQADGAAKLGIPVTALGIGKDWNDKLMQEIGHRTGGDADYISSAEQIRTHFTRTVQQMQAVALQRVSMNIRPALGVEVRNVYRVHPLIGRLNPDNTADRGLLVALGELEKGHGQTVLVEFVVPSRPAGSYRISQIDVDYDVPRTGVTAERSSLDVLLTYSHDPSAVPAPDPRVMNLAEKVSAFKLQTRALDDLEAGNVPAATQKLKGALTHLLNQGDHELAATVQQELDNLEKGKTMSPEGRKTIRFESGKTVRLGG
ncbi:MAG: VWA domain-containing protein [Chloroflexota bacterium]|nr:VWA domain-containing protein [Chloroflexota bacterium]